MDNKTPRFYTEAFFLSGYYQLSERRCFVKRLALHADFDIDQIGLERGKIDRHAQAWRGRHMYLAVGIALDVILRNI